MNEQNCTNCRFGRPNVNHHGHMEGMPKRANYLCRYAPPVVLVMTSEAGGWEYTCWPVVEADEWCGKYVAWMSPPSPF